jgi:hypothetical protein
MLKREIKYTDFDGNEVTDIFYFNVTKSEVVEVEVGHKQGMEEFLKNIVKTEDRQALVAEFKKIILLAYGEKSSDGKRFIKSDQLREEFSQTAAYDALFIELATSEDAAADFIKGILPPDLRSETEKQTLPAPPNITPVVKPKEEVVEIPQPSVSDLKNNPPKLGPPPEPETS